MNHSISTAELDELRREHIEELNEESEGDWAADNAPGSIGCHELLDRTSMLADSVERFVVSHPACVRDPEWFSLAQQAANSLQELYQRIGAEHLGQMTNDK
jgi:hypothetical protein